MHSIHPFQNESDTLQLGELNIENRLDRVCLYGSLDITKDKAGLANAKVLQTLLNNAVAELEKTSLPDHITISKTDTVPNPFANSDSAS